MRDCVSCNIFFFSSAYSINSFLFFSLYFLFSFFTLSLFLLYFFFFSPFSPLFLYLFSTSVPTMDARPLSNILFYGAKLGTSSHLIATIIFIIIVATSIRFLSQILNLIFLINKSIRTFAVMKHPVFCYFPNLL